MMRAQTLRLGLAWLAVTTPLAACNDFSGRLAAHNGYRAYAAREFDVAIAHYAEASSRLPNDATLKRNLALSHFAASRAGTSPTEVAEHLHSAVRLLRQMLEVDPTDKELTELLLNAWLESGRFDEAAEYFNARAQSTHSDEAYRMLGLVEAQRGNYRAAVAAYRERARLKPNDPAVQFAVASLSWEWLRGGGPDNALAAVEVANQGLDAALECDRLDPSHPSALVYAGLLLRERAARRENPGDAETDTRLAEEMLARFRARQPPTDAPLTPAR